MSATDPEIDLDAALLEANAEIVARWDEARDALVGPDPEKGLAGLLTLSLALKADDPGPFLRGLDPGRLRLVALLAGLAVDRMGCELGEMLAASLH